MAFGVPRISKMGVHRGVDVDLPRNAGCWSVAWTMRKHREEHAIEADAQQARLC